MTIKCNFRIEGTDKDVNEVVDFFNEKDFSFENVLSGEFEYIPSKEKWYWYSFGVEGNAFDFLVKSGREYTFKVLGYCFPADYFLKISIKFPKVTFDCMFAEEAIGKNVNNLIYKRGRMIWKREFIDLLEEQEFWLELWDEYKDDFELVNNEYVSKRYLEILKEQEEKEALRIEEERKRFVKTFVDQYAIDKKTAVNFMKGNGEIFYTGKLDYLGFKEDIEGGAFISDYDLQKDEDYKDLCEVCNISLVRDINQKYKGLKCCDSCYSTLTIAEEKYEKDKLKEKEAVVEENRFDRFIDF